MQNDKKEAEINQLRKKLKIVQKEIDVELRNSSNISQSAIMIELESMRNMLQRKINSLLKSQVNTSQSDDLTSHYLGTQHSILIRGKKMIIKIVPEDDVNPDMNFISAKSPLGIAIINAQSSKKGTIATPVGEISFQLLKP